jgi:indolepyruvate decarboxylase
MSPPPQGDTAAAGANGVAHANGVAQANGIATPAAAAAAAAPPTPATPTATTTTVAAYVVERLAALGVRHLFGVPGDYAFPILNAAERRADLSIRISPNELQAAYAADGYARATGGAAALVTTYGVGELSAINGVMGSRSHRLPVIHVVGGPSSRLYERRLVTHHSLGDGAFLRFASISAQACVAHATLTPQNAAEEVERVLRDALRYSGPGYLLVPNDFALMPVVDPAAPTIAALDRSFEATQRRACVSVPGELDAAVADVIARLRAARSAVVVPTALAARYGADAACRRFLRASGLRHCTTPMDKGCAASLGEDPAGGFAGIYSGASSHPASCRAEVEGADLVLDLASSNADLNRGFFTAKLDARRVAIVSGGSVRCGSGGSSADGGAGCVYSGVGMRDFLERLADAAEGGALEGCPAVAAARERTRRAAAAAEAEAEGDGEGATAAAAAAATAQQEEPPLRRGPSGGPRVPADDLYPRLQAFLRPGDTLVAESGSCMLRLPKLRLPPGAKYESQALWASIGWATAAAHGMAAAGEVAAAGGGHAPGRVVVVTGDGAFQMTGTEVGAIARYGGGGGGGGGSGLSRAGSTAAAAARQQRCSDVVLLILNNAEYGIEATIGEPGHPYDDLAPWRYSELPDVLGCPRDCWFTARVSDADALDAALGEVGRRRAVADAVGGGAARFSVIEVLTPPQECWRPLPEQALRAMYAAPTPKPPSAHDLRTVGSGGGGDRPAAAAAKEDD